jgi:hypothetical protein
MEELVIEVFRRKDDTFELLDRMIPMRPAPGDPRLKAQKRWFAGIAHHELVLGRVGGR